MAARTAALVCTLALLIPGGSVVASADANSSSASTTESPGESNTASARAQAEEQGKRVEITSKRTEDSTTWADPNGALTTEVFQEPIRVRQSGAWTPVDTTLADTGASVTPGATAADLNFSDGGTGPFAKVTDGGTSLALSVGGDLPSPTLEGNTATYAGAVSGGDLVVTALPGGFSEQVILHERPDGPLTIRMPLTTSQGLQVSQAISGHLVLTDASGKTVADAPAPHMWDSAVDPASGLAAHDAPVTSRIENTDEGQVLVLTPDMTFLDSADVSYPLTIDPTTTLAVSTDTWLESPNYTDSQRSSEELRVGTYDGGTHRARAYLKFDVDDILGSHIVDTDLSLYSYWSSSCSTSGSGIRVRRVTSDWDSSAVTWDTVPTVTGTGEVVNTGAHGYSSACPAAYSHWDIDAIVQAWADGAPNYGIQLRAVDETDSLTWRRYRSANYVSGDDAEEPHLTITYEDAELAGITDSSDLTTPVVSNGTIKGADGNTVAGADVVLYAWPDNESDDALEEGDSVKLQPVAKAVSDSSGDYTLRVASASSLTPQAAADGTVNFETVAYSGSQQAVFNFPRTLVTASSTTAYLAATTDAATSDTDTTSMADTTPVVADLVMDNALSISAYSSSSDGASNGVDEESSSAPESLTDDPDSATASAADDTAAAESEASDTTADAGVAKGCNGTLVKGLGAKWVIAGQTYSATTGVKHTFSYSKGADSSLGVGVSASGTYGSFTSSGSVSKSSSITMEYPAYGNNRGVYYKTEYSYGKYLVACQSPGRGTPVTHHYEVRARGYYGGAKTSTAYIPTAKHCAYQQKDTKFTRTTSHAITWSDGASVADVIGIDLSAETGYSSDATVEYTFNANRYICGTGGAPGGSHPYNFVATTTKSGHTR
ncbi:DNRLRE domain-containing protein [Streptomyces sp. STR69]|uniref:DNRLRE domain-containing protein n=1 Tax=Streptomyces sp. STR69 TaxID=1796942 RepID=UPI0021C7F145|nr:DNRLRE domain-containing protein [Streptomyces sp. STR69]